MDPTAELRALAHTLVEQLDEAMPLFETIAAEIESCPQPAQRVETVPS